MSHNKSTKRKDIKSEKSELNNIKKSKSAIEDSVDKLFADFPSYYDRLQNSNNTESTFIIASIKDRVQNLIINEKENLLQKTDNVKENIMHHAVSIDPTIVRLLIENISEDELEVLLKGQNNERETPLMNLLEFNETFPEDTLNKIIDYSNLILMDDSGQSALGIVIAKYVDLKESLSPLNSNIEEAWLKEVITLIIQEQIKYYIDEADEELEILDRFNISFSIMKDAYNNLKTQILNLTLNSIKYNEELESILNEANKIIHSNKISKELQNFISEEYAKAREEKAKYHAQPLSPSESVGSLEEEVGIISKVENIKLIGEDVTPHS